MVAGGRTLERRGPGFVGPLRKARRLRPFDVLIMLLLLLLRLDSGCDSGATEPPPSPAASRGVSSPGPAALAPPSRFRDVTAALGVSFRHEQGRVLWYLPQVTGSGVAMLDYDGDGQLDSFFVQGSGPDEGKIPGNVEPGVLYRNTGGKLEFEQAGTQAGVQPCGYGMSVAAWDHDNDGYVDLALTYYRQPSRLYHNDGDGTFREVSNQSGLSDPSLIWPTCLTAFDYDRDGFLDLFQGGYIHFLPADWIPDPKVRDEGHGPVQETLLPGHYRGLVSQLYHQDSAGRFTDRGPNTGVLNPDGQALNALAADLDGDGWQDLYVANDSHSKCVVYRNRGGGRFGDASAGSYADEMRGSMGVALGDVDLDGLPDLLVTHWLNATGLYRSMPGSAKPGRRIRFVDRALHQGLMMDRPLVGWAVAFLDVDNDGFEDILQVHGHTGPPPRAPKSGRLEKQPSYLFRNQRDGYFELVVPSGDPADPLGKERVGRAAAFGDLDRDGTVDVLLSANNGPAEAWMNSGTPAAWAGFWLVGSASNREAVGARLELQQGTHRRWKEVASGESYMATNARHLLFGLAEREAPVDVTVRWPSGLVEEFVGRTVRRYHRLVEGTGRAGSRI